MFINVSCILIQHLCCKTKPFDLICIGALSPNVTHCFCWVKKNIPMDCAVRLLTYHVMATHDTQEDRHWVLEAERQTRHALFYFVFWLFICSEVCAVHCTAGLAYVPQGPRWSDTDCQQHAVSVTDCLQVSRLVCSTPGRRISRQRFSRTSSFDAQPLTHRSKRCSLVDDDVKQHTHVAYSCVSKNLRDARMCVNVIVFACLVTK